MMIYKIMARTLWEKALQDGVFKGAPVDLADGYIHFSTASQVRETALRHFADQDDLVLVAFKGVDLGAALRFEPSRGGALFPHFYGRLDPALAVSVLPLPLEAGQHRFPDGLIP